MDIKFKEGIGRYAIASRDLNPGEEIFSEVPFAFGPKADSPLVCLGCYKPVDGAITCSSCGWPVCGKDCELTPAHKNAECVVFSKSKVIFYKPANAQNTCLQYECITPLRVLLAMESNPVRWKQEVEIMEAHNTRRIHTPIWNFNQINIVNYLRGPCKLEDVFEADLIHTVCGILESNAFEARTASNNLIRCLYPKLAILSHNCISNINHSISVVDNQQCDFMVKVKAATQIDQGVELFSSYTYSLWPTLVRREHLKQSKFFDCNCKRCADPTELGTYTSALKCETCSVGFIISTNPLENAAAWKCSNCKKEITALLVKQLFTSIQEDLDSCSTLKELDLGKHLEDALQRYSSILHPQNAYLCLIKSTLLQLYKTAAMADRKIVYCQDLLNVLNVIEPGFSRIRGVALFELTVGLIYSTSTKENGVNLEENLKRIENILTECSTILKNESPLTLEGKIGNCAKLYLMNIKKCFDYIVQRKVCLNELLNI